MSWNRLQPNWIPLEGLLSSFSKPANLIFQSTVHSLFLRKPQLSSKVAILAGLSRYQSEAFGMSPLQLTRTRTIPRRVQCWALSLGGLGASSNRSDGSGPEPCRISDWLLKPRTWYVWVGSWSAGFAKPIQVTAGLLVPPGEVADLAVSTWRCPPG